MPTTLPEAAKKPIRYCTERKKDGSPCKNRAMRGRNVCKTHTGDENVGRPSKFTSETRQAILNGLHLGLYRKDAALLGGIGTSTLNEWLDIATKHQTAGIDSEFSAFSDAVAMAEAEHKARMIGRITAAAMTDWKAAAWLMERKHPQEYGRKDAKIIEHMGTVGVEGLLNGRQPVDVPPAVREQIIALLEAGETIEGTATEIRE